MWTVAVNGSQVGWFGLRVSCHLALNMHSSYERTGRLLPWLCHDNSNINIGFIVVDVIYYYYFLPTSTKPQA